MSSTLPLAHLKTDAPFHSACLSLHPLNRRPFELGQRRNLVVCIDGASNKHGIKNTNIIELYNLISKDEAQLTHYNSGIGAYVHPWGEPQRSKRKQGRKNASEPTFARVVKDVYKWLAETYREGDILYFFGSSRGAYQVRALSAMIKKVGLIQKGNEAQIPYAYEVYADSHSSDHDEGILSEAERFKRVFSRDVQVHFVGALDTVSSDGYIRGKPLPMTTDGMTHVCHFRHALALDESHTKYSPIYASGDDIETKSPEVPRKETQEMHEVAGAPSSEKPSTNPVTMGDVKEVWFAGTHLDIGGGGGDDVEDKTFGRSGPPLAWMMSEAVNCGLLFSDSKPIHEWTWEYKDGPHKPSIWRRLPRYMSIKKPTYGGQSSTTQRGNAQKDRKILPEQFIHGSVVFNEEEYASKALGPDQRHLEWANVVEHQNVRLENDILGSLLVLASDTHENARHNIEDEESGIQRLKDLTRVITSPGGAWILHKAPGMIARTITQIRNDKNKEISDSLFRALLEAEDLIGSRETFHLLLREALSEDSKQRAQSRTVLIDYMRRTKLSWYNVAGPDGSKLSPAEIGNLCDTGIFALVYTGGAIHSITFTPDGEHIVSGSDDNTVQIWDFATGHCIKQLSGHTDWVRSAAVSPDGKLIASGSTDETIRIWDLETGASVGEPWKGHTNDVDAVVFSPDGKRIVSGSDDRTVRIWDIVTGRCIEQLSGHTHRVWSVAVSPDGKRIASGSWDNSIRIWDLETGASVGEAWEEHPSSIRSVAFSPDGHSIVSGSGDRTVQVWDATTGRCIKQLSGHTNVARSVAVSPDGKLIASGSWDHTIRIWNLETGVSVGKPLTGHTNWVNSIAFSPDGQYIISGSYDKTIRRWRLSALGINSSNSHS